MTYAAEIRVVTRHQTIQDLVLVDEHGTGNWRLNTRSFQYKKLHIKL
jgi:hypothetical protein